MLVGEIKKMLADVPDNFPIEAIAMNWEGFYHISGFNVGIEILQDRVFLGHVSKDSVKSFTRETGHLLKFGTYVNPNHSNDDEEDEDE